MTEEKGIAAKHEAVPQQLDDHSLVDGYRKGEVGGEAVMARLLEKIEMADRSEELLRRKDGTPFADDEGRQLRAVDYMDVAGKHGASDIILSIVSMSETDPRFPNAKEAISFVVSQYLPPQEADTA
jgi:hypothetical protein